MGGTNNASSASEGFNPSPAPGPAALVYKTKGDYRNLVPVMLSEDRASIVSYPDPSDIRQGGIDAVLPTALREGYLLDNRGINRRVAFLSMSYGEYAKLEKAPSVEKMLALILEKDPLVELCDCGNKMAQEDPLNQLNSLIKDGSLRSKCRAIQ